MAKPKRKLIALVVPVELYERLERMADAADEPIEDLAERFLREIATEFVRQAEAA